MCENNKEDKTSIILFDGVCNLCNSSVRFIIKHDKKNRFLFAPLQSEKAKELLSKYKIEDTDVDSIVLLKNNRVYLKSSAALQITKHLNGLYPLLSGLIIVPKFIRNFVYDVIARNRYKWFGGKENCMVPTSELKAKFIS